MVESFAGLNIDALATAIPSNVVAIDAASAQFGNDAIARFKEVTGIHSRPEATPEQCTSDFAQAAAEAIFADGKCTPDEIDALLFITQTPDSIAPATSALLQQRLHLREDIFALDINQGCAGFAMGLLTAAHLLSSPAIKRVLILGGDTLSRLTDPTDAASALLFGDAGFAAIISAQGAPATFMSCVSGNESISIPCQNPTFKMQGFEVFNFTVTRVPEQIQALLKATQTTCADYDALLLHQANAFIVKQVGKLSGFDKARVPCAIESTGNTSSASLPLLMTQLKMDGWQGSKKVLLSAFGVGFTWVSASLTIDFDACLPLVYLPGEQSL